MSRRESIPASERSNLAQECISRPTKGIIRPGPGIPAWPGQHTIIRPSRCRKEAAMRGFPARPDSPNPAQPGRAGGWRPAGGRGPTGAEQGAQPGCFAGREPRQGAGPAALAGEEAHPGAHRPSRGAGREAQPGHRPDRHAGAEEEEACRGRPGWRSPAQAQERGRGAGPGRWGGAECRPGR
jgi:hypothetical protein